ARIPLSSERASDANPRLVVPGGRKDELPEEPWHAASKKRREKERREKERIGARVERKGRASNPWPATAHSSVGRCAANAASPPDPSRHSHREDDRSTGGAPVGVYGASSNGGASRIRAAARRGRSSPRGRRRGSRPAARRTRARR